MRYGMGWDGVGLDSEWEGNVMRSFLFGRGWKV
jgi:hypothetical protein